MLTAAPLHTRERTGLVIASAALAVARNPLNRQVRVWLRDEVVHGVPFWLDHLLFMLIVVVWGAIGLLVLGPRGMSRRRPARPREAWWRGALRARADGVGDGRTRDNGDGRVRAAPELARDVRELHRQFRGCAVQNVIGVEALALALLHPH